MHIKAVLVIGQVSDTSAGSSTLANWVLTIGNNSDPILNPTFMSATTKWNMSIDVNAWGQNVAIHRTDRNAPLILGYVAVFAAAYDCNLTNTVTVASLPATIPTSSTHTYTVTNSLNASCIE